MNPRISLAVLALAVSPLANASDGTFQISDVCATSIGCFPGDTAGLPVTITQSGSYRLTSNLSTTGLNTTIIEISANDVSIDLNGFSLRGPVTCSGSPLACTGQSSSVSSGAGIRADSVERLSVHSGTVTGMGGSGVTFGTSVGSASVHDLNVSENGRSGLVIQAGIVRDVIADSNAQNGIGTLFGSVYVRDSVVRQNGAIGLGLGSFCSGIVSVGNGSGTTCTGLGPNVCETPANCD